MMANVLRPVVGIFHWVTCMFSKTSTGRDVWLFFKALGVTLVLLQLFYFK
jgi:hypothetical protein